MIASSSRRSLATAAAVIAAAASALIPATASAHALIGKRDLPLPPYLFVYGVLLVLVVSFVGLLLGWREPRLEAGRERPLERFSKLLLSRPVQILAGAIGVALLAVVVLSGLRGVVAPDRNFSVTFVFVTFWIGMVVASVLLGNVFRAFNPWRAIGRAASFGFTRLVGQEVAPPLRYPERLGRWPAAVGLFGFLFFELVWGQSGFAAAGVTPLDVAIATLVYSAITLAAMALYGVDAWIERGEAFSVYFGMFASLSPFEVREGRILLRRPLSGAARWSGPAGSLAVVLVAIAGTTYDGAQEGVLREPIGSLFNGLTDVGFSPLASLRLTNVVFLTATIAAVALIFWAGIWGMRIVERKLSAAQLGKAFAYAFVPIALAYVIAHYFSYVFYLEQAQFTFLLSDPLGDGSDLFGTATSGIDYAAIGANTIWYVQVAAIVSGHVVALALGHERALKLWGSNRDAAWSQVWMLVMMMFFSVLGLVLLSQANG